MPLPQSTTTLLIAVNDVLLDTGERAVPTLSTTTAQKAVKCLRDALMELSIVHDWQHYKDTIRATSWSGNTATLVGVQRIDAVAYLNSGRSHYLTYVDPLVFETLESRALSSAAELPQHYTVPDYQRVKLTPYPVDPTERSNVLFRILYDPKPPMLPNATFPLPERFIPLLEKKAAALMAVRHLDDSTAAKAFTDEYEQDLLFLKTRERGVPKREATMFKNGRW